VTPRSSPRALAWAGLVSLLLSACSPEFKGQAITPARPLPTFSFRQADGSTFSTAPVKGSATVLFFGYTRCPDVCPTTLADWKRVRAQLGADTAHVRFVFVSIDPERDTPAIAEAYVRGYHPSFIALAGDTNTIRRMVKTFGIAVIPDNATDGAPVPQPMGQTVPHDHTASGQLIGHSSQAFLIDDRGRLVAMYSAGTSWESLLADLRALL
jgi:protein SCO1